MKTTLKLAVLTAMISLVTAGATWATIAYDNASGVGGLQNFGNSLGLDFDVNPSQPINITALGAFDNGDTAMLDGVAGGGVTVAIYDRTTGLQVGPSVLFTSGSPGTQINGDAFKDIPYLTLPAGFQGSVVAWNDHNYNAGLGPNLTSTFNSGGGLISSVGKSRWGSGFVYPGNTDSIAHQYDAGTFQFQGIPEPSTLMLVGLGLAGLWATRKRFAS